MREILISNSVESKAVKKLARFGHHPEPIIDYEIEIDIIEGMIADVISGNGNLEETKFRIDKAWLNVIDPEWIKAKNNLRVIEDKLRTYKTSRRALPGVSIDEGLEELEADGLGEEISVARREMPFLKEEKVRHEKIAFGHYILEYSGSELKTVEDLLIDFEGKQIDTRYDQKMFEITSIALTFLQHPECSTVKIGNKMVPRDIWIDEVSSFIDEHQKYLKEIR